MCVDTLILVAVTLLPVVLLLVLSPEARQSLTTYFMHQVMGSLENICTVTSRFAIVVDFLTAIVHPLLIASIVLWLAKTKGSNLKSVFRNLPLALSLFMLSLSGVLPIMISLKQRAFYIDTVYPFFAIALTLFLLFLSIGFSYLQIKHTGRDKDEISDVHRIINRVGQNTPLGISSQLFSDWHLHG